MIPDKSWFKIGEVERITGVRQHTLRQWERDFERLCPEKSASGQRIFSREDVELVLVLKTLMHEKRFTVDGARQELDRLEDWKAAVLPPDPDPAHGSAGPRRLTVRATTRRTSRTTPTSAPPRNEPPEPTVTSLSLPLESPAPGAETAPAAEAMTDDPHPKVSTLQAALDAQVRLAAELSRELAAAKHQSSTLEAQLVQARMAEAAALAEAESARTLAASLEHRHADSLASADRAREEDALKLRALESALDRVRTRADEQRAGWEKARQEASASLRELEHAAEHWNHNARAGRRVG